MIPVLTASTPDDVQRLRVMAINPEITRRYKMSQELCRPSVYGAFQILYKLGAINSSKPHHKPIFQSRDAVYGTEWRNWWYMPLVKRYHRSFMVQALALYSWCCLSKIWLITGTWETMSSLQWQCIVVSKMSVLTLSPLDNYHKTPLLHNLWNWTWIHLIDYHPHSEYSSVSPLNINDVSSNMNVSLLHLGRREHRG